MATFMTTATIIATSSSSTLSLSSSPIVSQCYLCREKWKWKSLSRPTLCDPMDCSQPRSSIHGDSPDKNTGVGCYALLHRIFPIHGSNLGLLHCRWIPYYLSYQGSPRILEWVSLSLLQGNFLTQESNWGLLHCRWILHQLSYLGSLVLTFLHNIHVYYLYEKTTINKQCYLKTMPVKFKYNYKSSYLFELYWHLNMILLK